MRKLFISALLALSLGTSAFATGENKVNFSVQNSFQGQFKDASNVEWSTGKGYAKATFVQNNEKIEAFYNLDGEMIGTSRTAHLDKLPTNAKRAFAKKFEGYTVKEAIRFEGTEESAYFISAENEKGSVILKVEDNGSVSMKKI